MKQKARPFSHVLVTVICVAALSWSGAVWGETVGQVLQSRAGNEVWGRTDASVHAATVPQVHPGCNSLEPRRRRPARGSHSAGRSSRRPGHWEGDRGAGRH